MWVCVSVCVLKPLQGSMCHQGGLSLGDQAAAFALWSVMCVSRLQAIPPPHTHTQAEPTYTNTTSLSHTGIDLERHLSLPLPWQPVSVTEAKYKGGLARSKHSVGGNLLRLLIDGTAAVSTAFCHFHFAPFICSPAGSNLINLEDIRKWCLLGLINRILKCFQMRPGSAVSVFFFFPFFKSLKSLS